MKPLCALRDFLNSQKVTLPEDYLTEQNVLDLLSLCLPQTWFLALIQNPHKKDAITIGLYSTTFAREETMNKV
jgi:hypothetical protein